MLSSVTAGGYKTQFLPGLPGGEAEDSDLSMPSKPAGKQCVVIIEDNPGDVFVIEEALRQHHVECETTVLSDGEEAASFFERLDNDAMLACPGVVLLDLNLPKRSGHWVLRRIRGCQRCPFVPVVIVSSSEAPADMEIDRQVAATTYFKKSSILSEFIALGAVVNDLLSVS